MECIIAALEFPLTTYPRHTARRRTHHAMLCRISSDSALLQFSTLTMTNAECQHATLPRFCPIMTSLCCGEQRAGWRWHRVNTGSFLLQPRHRFYISPVSHRAGQGWVATSAAYDPSVLTIIFHNHGSHTDQAL